MSVQQHTSVLLQINFYAFYAKTFLQYTMPLQLSVTNIKTQTLAFLIYLYTSGGTHRTPPGLAGRSLPPAAVRMQRQLETRPRTQEASQSQAAPSAPGQQPRQGPVAEGWVNWQLVHCPFWRWQVHVSQRNCWKQKPKCMWYQCDPVKDPFNL